MAHSQPPGDAWQAVLGDLELRVTRPSYETWLRDTTGLDYRDGQFVVGAPNTFVAEMLEQRMYSLISESMERVVATGLDIRFEVVSPGKGPAATRNGNQRASVPADSIGVADGAPAPSNGAHPPAELNPGYSFDSFIVGRSNELAHAAASAVSESPGSVYNPLFIYSGVGLGKTHLLHAIGHNLTSQGLSPIYATTEEFTNEYIKAIREGKTEAFRARYRSADALLLDDIQFIIGKEQTQEGFFHTFNSLHLAGRQVVITSDRPVTNLTLLEDRVSSRLAAGLVVDIQTPDTEMRMDILRSKAAGTGQRFPDEVLDFLAERVHKNVRELEGNLNRIVAYAQLTDNPISVDLVKKALADSLRTSGRNKVSDEQVIAAVCSYFSIDVEVLKGRRRDKETALARQVAMYLLREDANLTLKAVGAVLGGKDHTTVMHACVRISSLVNEDAELRRDLISIRETLAS
jgi:chromosomal replication initiator protein